MSSISELRHPILMIFGFLKPTGRVLCVCKVSNQEKHYFKKITSSEKKTPLTEQVFLDLLMLVRKWTFKDALH